MGRPSQNYTKRVTIRLKPEEFEQLRQDAETAAVELATIARAHIVGAPVPRRARRHSADHVIFARALMHLGRLGGNLNQIAKVANAKGDLTAVQNVAVLRSEVAQLREMVRRALAP
jgi:hypothetical protein